MTYRNEKTLTQWNRITTQGSCISDGSVSALSLGDPLVLHSMTPMIHWNLDGINLFNQTTSTADCDSGGSQALIGNFETSQADFMC